MENIRSYEDFINEEYGDLGFVPDDEWEDPHFESVIKGGNNENIDFEDWDDEESIESYINDEQYEVVKYRYNDEYSYGGYRFLIKNINNNNIIKTINNTNSHLYEVEFNGDLKSITDKQADLVFNDTITLTCNSVNPNNWKYSEIRDKINIINV